MSREENIEIFKDTEKLCKTNPFLIQAWKYSSENQKLILENESVDFVKDKYEKQAKITVSKKRTFEAAMEYNDKKVNVITCAAPNLRERPSNSFNIGDGNNAVSVTDEELDNIHIKRGRKILEVAAANENEVVILGAFGCGAFMNKPEVVAKAYEKLIDEFKNEFQEIQFAVYCSPRDESNFKIFREILK